MEMHITAVEQHYCKNKEHILYYITDGVVDIIITIYNIVESCGAHSHVPG